MTNAVNPTSCYAVESAKPKRGKKKPAAPALMNPEQQKQVITILKKQVAHADEQNANSTGYCDDEEIMKIRVLLIELKAMPDRRGKK